MPKYATVFDGKDTPVPHLICTLMDHKMRHHKDTTIPPTADDILSDRRDTLQTESEFWQNFDTIEFLEDQEVITSHVETWVPSLLTTYPTLLANIKFFLATHGTEAAEARRRDDRAYTIGVSLSNIRQILKEEYDQDVSETRGKREEREEEVAPL